MLGLGFYVYLLSFWFLFLDFSSSIFDFFSYYVCIVGCLVVVLLRCDKGFVSFYLTRIMYVIFSGIWWFCW